MQEHKYSIKHWSKDEKPSEKLLSYGAGILSNSELLAILLRSGTRQKNAIDLAKELLKLGKDSLSELSKLSAKELMKIEGIGPSSAIMIMAALELGRRREVAVPLEKLVIKTSSDIARYLHTRLRDHRHEVFGVLYLNRANKVNGFEIVSEGGITGTIADPRIILRRALEEDAVNIILFHNHPSGSLKPSRVDELLTAKIRDAALMLDIRVIDHIIVSESGYYSFADEGLM